MRHVLSSAFIGVVFSMIALPAILIAQATKQGASLQPTSALPARVPYRLISGIVTLEASIASGKPIRSALDTGLTTCIASEKLAEAARMTRLDAQLLQAPLGPLTVTTSSPINLRIGSAMFSSVPMSIGDVGSQISSDRSLEWPELWIGLPVLMSCAIVLDPTDSSATLIDSGAPPPRGSRLISIEVRDGRIEAPVILNGKGPESWTVSTATPGTVVSSRLAKLIQPKVENLRDVKTSSGRMVRIGASKFEDLRLGSVKINGVTAVVPATDGPEVAGVIGTDVLLRHVVYINCAKRQMALAPRRAQRGQN